MLFKLTHIGRDGHRRKGHVSACNLGDAMDQVLREFGEPRAMALVRMSAKPVLHEVAAHHEAPAAHYRVRAC